MLLSIIITIISCVAWWRLLQESLQFYHLRKSTIMVLIGLNIIAVISIISFPSIYHTITQSSRLPLSTKGAGLYVGYSIVVTLLLGVIVFYRQRSEYNKQRLLVGLVALLLSVGGPYWGRYPLYYYLIAACVEEYIKYCIGLGSFRLYGTMGSDIILFGMMSGLGFACIENIIFLINGGGELIINISRWVVGPIVHMIYSGIIVYSVWWASQYKLGIGGALLGFIVTALLHTSYNTRGAQAGRPAWIAVVLVGYIGVSWLLYQCDRLYYQSAQ